MNIVQDGSKNWKTFSFYNDISLDDSKCLEDQIDHMYDWCRNNLHQEFKLQIFQQQDFDSLEYYNASFWILSDVDAFAFKMTWCL